MTLRALLVAALSLTLAWTVQAAEPIVVKFSHVVAPNTPKGMGAEKFKALAERYSGGAVVVEVYPNSTLYKDKEEMEALQLGAVEIIAPSLAKFGPLGLRVFEAFDLPYIFDSYAELHKVTGGPLGARLLASLEPRGIAGLAFWDNGFKSFSANTPIRAPGDLRGKKMRIQSSKVLDAQMRALGALPQVTAFDEVYAALKARVVDGTENPHSNFYTQRMHEVQSHMTLTDHGYLGYAVITNKKFWDGLPGTVREALARAMREATEYTNQIAKAENDKALAAIRTAGTTEVHVPTAEERLAFKKALLPVHAAMAPRIGKDLIDAIYEETGFDPDRL
ncbi:TRAP transporter substrate-binding protein [Denitromonas iodatirespirans]|uniref:TRAP transporter substrate-binding protein n=1 Tax=Denitromonas iodatirespirans TaxID=2795389 RepID=A0A944H891_DENI1|nr:TRAP transporter substrate-binding protein [Denitromonas iodatirespirans]MBT0961135.1 TRAP transporter substrate-binding protein [Denitromonas iodatirespirans]